MINAVQALEITKIGLKAEETKIGALENEIMSAATLGKTSINVESSEWPVDVRPYLTDLGYQVLDCRFDDEWYVQVSWENK